MDSVGASNKKKLQKRGDLKKLQKISHGTTKKLKRNTKGAPNKLKWSSKGFTKKQSLETPKDLKGTLK